MYYLAYWMAIQCDPFWSVQPLCDQGLVALENLLQQSLRKNTELNGFLKDATDIPSPVIVLSHLRATQSILRNQMDAIGWYRHQLLSWRREFPSPRDSRRIDVLELRAGALAELLANNLAQTIALMNDRKYY